MLKLICFDHISLENFPIAVWLCFFLSLTQKKMHGFYTKKLLAQLQMWMQYVHSVLNFVLLKIAKKN